MANTNYTEEYKEQAFYIWYQADRKTGGQKLLSFLPEENGRKPARMVIEKWMSEYGWIERADALDAEVSRKLDEEVIDKRIKMFEEHARVGEALVAKGTEYLERNPLQDSQAAIRAITSGIEIQRDSVGKAEAWMKISRMTDLQITKELERLSGKQSKDDDFIDVESEDIGETESDTESTELEE